MLASCAFDGKVVQWDTKGNKPDKALPKASTDDDRL